MDTIDPYKTMQVNPRTFTFQELRANFKRLVLEYHPDRSAIQNITELNKSPVFQTLKFSYDYLVTELKKRDTDKPHHELKAQAQAQEQEQEHKQQHRQNVKIKTDRFDINKFNQVFDETRLKDVYDDGYNDWTEDTPPAQKAIVAYKDPEPYAMGRFSAAYELGRQHVDNFSGDTVGTNLKFMDFKLAHTTTLLVDPAAVAERPEFKSVDDIKKHRANKTILEPTEADIQRRHAEKIAADEQEAARLRALKEKDTLINNLFNKTHQLLLSAFGTE